MTHNSARPTISRRKFLGYASGLLAGRALSSTEIGKQPNVVLILADDLGYGDLGCYGGRELTQNIDRLAASGTRFTNFHSGAPMCSPSRAALLTGLYANRVGIPGVITPEMETGLVDNITIADVLRFYGYHTGCVGKWHLGRRREYLPTRHGFDKFRGVPYSHDMPELSDIDGENIVGDLTDKRDMLTMFFMESAINFVANAPRESPYFLYLPFTAPHRPLETSAGFRGMSGLGEYADTLLELDFAVGQVLAAIRARDANLGTNTLVMFMSDNGADLNPNLGDSERGSNWPLSDGKFGTGEGGTRGPFIVSLPGVIPEGRVSSGLLSAMDIKRTLGGLAGRLKGGDVGPCDGVDVLPVLTGQAEHVERTSPILYFRFSSLECASGRYLCDDGEKRTFKIRFAGEGVLPGRPRLYDIEFDLGEVSDIAPQYPEVVARMTAEVKAVLATFQPGVVSSNLL